MKISRLAKLLAHILQNGKLRHSGFDFTEKRNRMLVDLKAFHPGGTEKRTLTQRVKHPILRTLISETAYLVNSSQAYANHLSLARNSASYVRIPKAASTAICKGILQERYPELKARPMSPQQINSLADAHSQRAISEDDQITFFTVVRNPFARIVSVYREFFEKGETPFLYEDYLFGCFKQQISFREFVRILTLIPDNLKDQHVKPQHAFLTYYKNRERQVHVMKLEEPGLIKSYLLQHGVVFEEVNAGAGAYDYRKYYDRKLLADVYGIYEVDVHQFGYEAVYGDLNAYL